MIDTTVLLSFCYAPLVRANLMWWEALHRLAHSTTPFYCQTNHDKPLVASGLMAFGSTAFGLEALGSAASDFAASGLAASFLTTGFFVLLSASWLVPWVCRSWLRATSGFPWWVQWQQVT